MENIDFKHVNDDLPRYGEGFDYNGQKSDWCVYVHINKINGKKYIGISHDLKTRWKPWEYNGCTAFYNAIQKYGWENFDHIVLMNGLTKDMADEIEKELIKKYQTRKKANGYNIATGGWLTGLFGDSIHNSKQIHQYDLNGIYIQSFDSMSEASILINNSYGGSAIASALKHNHYAYGYLWNNILVDSMEPYKGKIIKKTQSYPEIIRVSMKDFSIIRYGSICDVSNSSHYRTIVLQCCGNTSEKQNRLSYDGYFWFFIDDYSDENVKAKYLEYTRYFNGPVIQYDLKGNMIKKYNSALETKKYNYSPNNVLRVCRGEQETHKGYQWRYEYDEAPSTYNENRLKGKGYAAIDINTHQIVATLYGTHEVSKFLGDESKLYGISRSINHPNHTAYGYYWRYIDENENVIYQKNDILRRNNV